MRHDCGTALNKAITIIGYWVWSTQRTCDFNVSFHAGVQFFVNGDRLSQEPACRCFQFFTALLSQSDTRKGRFSFQFSFSVMVVMVVHHLCGNGTIDDGSSNLACTFFFLSGLLPLCFARKIYSNLTIRLAILSKCVCSFVFAVFFYVFFRILMRQSFP